MVILKIYRKKTILYIIDTDVYPFLSLEVYMKIELEGTLIKMTPENDREKTQLNQLWTIIIGCIDEGKKLVPVGQYIPGVKEVAVFNIE
jgi:hypothetical protein